MFPVFWGLLFIFMYVKIFFLYWVLWRIMTKKKRRDIYVKQKQNLRIPKYSLILKPALIHGLNTFLGVSLSWFASNKSLRPARIHKIRVRVCMLFTYNSWNYKKIICVITLRYRLPQVGCTECFVCVLLPSCHAAGIRSIYKHCMFLDIRRNA